MNSRQLFTQAINEDWERFEVQSSSVLEDTVGTVGEEVSESVPEPFTPESSLLHVVCSYSSVPSNIVEDIVRQKPELVSSRDGHGQTPLHCAVVCEKCQPDIIRHLVTTSPRAAQQRDDGLLRPIDLLCQKMIMQEERSKYTKNLHVSVSNGDNNRKKRNNNDNDNQQNNLWDCIRLLAIAMSPPTSPTTTTTNNNNNERDWNSIPQLHACLRATPFDFPYAILERAMKIFVNQFHVQDTVFGDTPLHIVAGWSPDEDITDNFLEIVATKYPLAARTVNKNEKLPLDIAIENELRDWETGLGYLMQIYPAPGRFSIPISCLILGKVATNGQITILYEMLRNQSDLFAYR